MVDESKCFEIEDSKIPELFYNEEGQYSELPLN